MAAPKTLTDAEALLLDELLGRSMPPGVAVYRQDATTPHRMTKGDVPPWSVYWMYRDEPHATADTPSAALAELLDKAAS